MAQRKETVSGDGRLILAAGGWARDFLIGNAWTKIRVGGRFTLPAAATFGGSPILTIGVCAGPVEDGYDGDGVNCFGVRVVTASYVFAGSAGVNGYFGSLDWKVFKKVAGVETLHASNLSATLQYVSATQSIRTMLMLQIEKGSPNWTVRLVAPSSSAAAQSDVTDAEATNFMEMNDDMTSPNLIKTGYSLFNTNAALAFSEAGGDAGFANITWNRTAVECNISEVMYRVIAE